MVDRSGRRAETFSWLTFCGCLVLLFRDGLFLSQVPSFRDGLHFYYPQLVWQSECWEQGELVPRWNRFEGLGIAATAQPSESMFYPLRVLWLIDFFSIEQRYAFVVVLHLLLAAIGMRLAAAALLLPRSAACLAAFAYALSAPVLFQHLNLIYLFSAAWVGFAAFAAIRFLRQPQAAFKSIAGTAFGFSAASSMMVLAGDAHTAYNSLVVAAIVLVCAPRSIQIQSLLRTTAQRVIWFSAVIALCIAFTSPQWQCTLPWSAISDRTTLNPTPQTFGLPLLDAAIAETNYKPAGIYEFSVSPWQLLTLVFPTWAGTYHAENSRWITGLTSSSRMWIPSLFCGSIPLCLALFGCFQQSYARRAMLLALLCLLAAMGNYTLLWFTRQILSSLQLPEIARSIPSDALGGPYGWLASLAPWYALFRYPAKWTVLVAFFLCLASAYSLSKKTALTEPTDSHHRLKWWLLGLGFVLAILIVSCLCVAFVPNMKSALEVWLARHTNDVWLGPASISAVARVLLVSIALPLLTLGFMQFTRRLPWISVRLTLVELTVVGMFWVHYIPPSSLSFQSVPDRFGSDAFVWANTHAAMIVEDLRTPQSENVPISMEVQASYQMQFFLGKLSALSSVRALHANTSLTPQVVTQLKSWLRQRDNLDEENESLDEVLRELGVTHRLVRNSDRTPAIQWHLVSDPKPLCEWTIDDFVPGNTEHPKRSTFPGEFQWLSSDELEVRWNNGVTGSDTSGTRTLLVRQFNDGGWIARTDQGTEIMPDSNSLFLRFVVNGAADELLISRRW